MSQITGLIDGSNVNHDYQITALASSLINPGIISGLLVSSGSVAIGSAFIKCTRTNGQEIMIHYVNTDAVTIDTTGTKKVWIGVDQSDIDDGSSNAMDGTGIATIRTGASYPSGNYIPLASIMSGTITDDRSFVTFLPILGKGYGTNKHKRVNRSTGDEELKDVTDGSSIAPTDKIRFEKISGSFEDMPVSLLQNAIAGMTSEYIMGGSANANESVYLSVLDKFKDNTTPYADIGKTVATTSFKMYSSGNTEQRYTFSFTKTGAPQDLTFRIETDNAGAPSGTLVNANAVLATAIASITSGSSYEIVLPASFIPGPAGTPIWFVFWQGSQAVNASNYLSIALNKEVPVVFDRVTNTGANVTASRTVWGTTGTVTNPVCQQVIDCAVDCQLVSLGISDNISLLEIVNVTDGNILIYRDTVLHAGYALNEPVKLKSGKRYNINYTASGTVTNVTAYTSQSNSAHITWVSGGNGSGITSIVTRTATFTQNAGVLFTYISKALATTALKAAVYALLPQSAAAGSYPSIVKDRYLGGFSSLTKGATYYLSNTGVISSTAGTVSKVLGVAVNSTTIRIDSAINAS